MKMIVGLLLVLAAPASAAPINPMDPQVGHILVLTDEAQVYVRTEAQSVVFTAVLPPAWAYSILVDGDQNGVWGEGSVSSHDRRASPASPDFTYATSHGELCAQYVYTSYPKDPDIIYASSECGLRKSAATFRAGTISDALSAQEFTIPKSELRDGPGQVHFAIQIWNGSAFSVFGSPATPYVLTIGAN